MKFIKQFYAILLFFQPFFSFAQQLVKDINSTTTTNNYRHSNISDVSAVGGKTYFVANDYTSGDEPWVTDGTPAGTFMLRDIYPGRTGSAAKDFTISNGFVYFSANDGVHGAELWKTDGTQAGTVMVKDIISQLTASGIPISAGPYEMCDVNGILYFVAKASMSNTDIAIWKTDGTAGGTTLVSNLYVSSSVTEEGPRSLTNFNGELYFAEKTMVSATKNLYKITNTGTTVLVRDGMNIDNLFVCGSNLFFRGSATTTNYELWKTDGNIVGIVKEIMPGTSGSQISDMTAVNNVLFFTANDGVNGVELWKSDGTEAGTVMVKDIFTGINGSGPTHLTNVNGGLFFVANTTATGRELWKSDGTEAGTVLLKDIVAGGSSANPNFLCNSNGSLYFVAKNNKELWKSDGTDAGTILIKAMDICEQLANGTGLAGNVVFYGSVLGAPRNTELYITDGTAGGTEMIKNIAIDNPSSLYGPLDEIARFAHSNGQLFFGVRNTSVNIYSLYKTDGTDAGTGQLNAYGSTINPLPTDAVNTNGFIYFSFTDIANGTELWKSDGTAAGTSILKDIYPGPANSTPSRMFNLDGVVYFAANNGIAGEELWKTDGTATGTVLVKDIFPGNNNTDSRLGHFVKYKGQLFFTANNGSVGNELWKTDGTEAGTILVKDIFTGTSSGLVGGESRFHNYFTVMGDELFFTAIASTAQGTELWKTDGTEVGTVLVKDIVGTNNQGSSPRYITVMGNELFFAADDLGNGTNYELWKSDGTAIGTNRVKDINSGNDPSWPNNFIALNNNLYFSAYEPGTGYELWKSDGTEAGTQLVKDIDPGNSSGMQSGQVINNTTVPEKNIIEANGILYFPGVTAATGRELWQSDGTTAGTTPTIDLFAGTQSSDPGQITSANGAIYFIAENGSTGKELYTLNPNPFFVLPSGNALEVIHVNWQNNALVQQTNQIIATIKQAGVKPVDGQIQTSVTIGSSAIVYNGRTLAAKHFDIEPQNEPGTSTANITLYFSQADFEAYNMADIINSDLPTHPSDITGKSALRIIQYHGVGTTPGTYTGIQEVIDPSDDSIVWNASNGYWQVSFPVNGFSGFYLSSVNLSVVPVSLISFTGRLHANNTMLLKWKVEEQQGIAPYEIERSQNGNDFEKIGTVTANAQRVFGYDFSDNQVPAGISYYRIKITGQDGSIYYSNIIKIELTIKGTVSLYPVPATDRITISIAGIAFLKTMATILDNNGRLVIQQLINTNQQDIDISMLSAGIYFVQLSDGKTIRFQKQKIK